MTAKSANPVCDGLVLSGGQGKRVDGRDKGLLRFANGTAVSHALAQLAPLCETLYVSANRHLDDYATLPSVTVLPDLRRGYPGPLGALEAAAKQPLAPLLLLLPNDLPLLDGGVVSRLLETLRGADPALQLVYASDGTNDQYLCACVRSECLADAGRLLDTSEHRVRQWLALLNTQRVVFSGDAGRSLKNFNSTAQWSSISAGK